MPKLAKYKYLSVDSYFYLYFCNKKAHKSYKMVFMSSYMAVKSLVWD